VNLQGHMLSRVVVAQGLRGQLESVADSLEAWSEKHPQDHWSGHITDQRDVVIGAVAAFCAVANIKLSRSRPWARPSAGTTPSSRTSNLWGPRRRPLRSKDRRTAIAATIGASLVESTKFSGLPPIPIGQPRAG
jgi:hypothetical protein